MIDKLNYKLKYYKVNLTKFSKIYKFKLLMKWAFLKKLIDWIFLATHCNAY